jgi:hypothetical protein
MHWTKLVLIAMISAAALVPNFGDTMRKKISRCKPQNDHVNAPDYEIGVTYEAPSEIPSGLEAVPQMTVVHISISPDNINRDDLLRLVHVLKSVFCKEDRLFAVLFDDPAYIEQIYVPVQPLFQRAEQSKRGYYYVDRKSGQEYLTFCAAGSIRKNLVKAVWIDLGTTPSPKPQGQ